MRRPVAGKRYRVLCSTVYGGFGSNSAGGSSTGSGGGSSVGVGGAGGVFGIGRGLFGSGGVGGTSISARIRSRPLCCARLSCSLIEHLQIHRILSVAFTGLPDFGPRCFKAVTTARNQAGAGPARTITRGQSLGRRLPMHNDYDDPGSCVAMLSLDIHDDDNSPGAMPSNISGKGAARNRTRVHSPSSSLISRLLAVPSAVSSTRTLVGLSIRIGSSACECC